MGDRANVKIIDGVDNPVWLYSHWGGGELPEILHMALNRRQRWTDPSYLSRIIFCQMVKGQEDGETGFGISSVIGDNEHLILVVDVENQTVFLEEEKGDVFFKPIPIESFVLNPQPLYRAYQRKE